jgi:hypothetical protein
MMAGSERATSADGDALDSQLIDSLWIEDEFGEDALDALVEHYCRSVLSVDEITSYRRLAGVVPAAPLVQLSLPASPEPLRRAA